jgi:hypothetical protein
MIEGLCAVPGLVSAHSESVLPGGVSDYYTLGPGGRRIRCKQHLFHAALANIINQRLGVDEFETRSPPVLTIQGVCVVAALKGCFDAESERRAVVCFDLDHLGADTDPDLFDSEAVAVTIARWLNEYADGGGDFTMQRCIVTSGSFPEAGKPISAHVIFPDCVLVNDEATRYKNNERSFAKLDEQLKEFGVKADRTITSSGFALEWFDKWDKDHWRGKSKAVTGMFNFASTISVREFVRCIDATRSDIGGHSVVHFKRLASPPRQRRRVDDQAAVQGVVVAPGIDDPLERVYAAVPQWQGVPFKSRLKDNVTFVEFDSTYCPNKHDATDLPAHQHGSSRKVWALIGYRIVIGCNICAGRIEIEPDRAVTDQQQAVIDEFDKRFGRMQDKMLQFPVRLRDGSFTPARELTHLEFQRQERVNGKNVVVQEEGKTKVTVMHQCDFYLLQPQRFPYGRICDPSNSCDPGYYNEWTGYNPVVVEEAADMVHMSDDALIALMPLWWSHMTTNVCNDEEALIGYCLNWLAMLLQHPEKKTGTALVLTGEQGAGKGRFVAIMRTIIGMAHSIQVDNTTVVADFNSTLANMLLVFVDESHSDNDPKHTAKMKMLITEGDKHGATVTEKYKNTRVQQVFQHLIMCSNSPTKAFTNDEANQRRFVALMVKFKLHANRSEAFHAFMADLSDEVESTTAAAALYTLLMRRDLSNWRPQVLPLSQAEWLTRHEQMSIYGKFLYRVLRTNSVIDDYECAENKREALQALLHDQAKDRPPEIIVSMQGQRIAAAAVPRDSRSLGRAVFDEPRQPLPKDIMLAGCKAVYDKSTDVGLWQYLHSLFLDKHAWSKTQPTKYGTSLALFVMPPLDVLRDAWLTKEGVRTDKVFDEWAIDY